MCDTKYIIAVLRLKINKKDLYMPARITTNGAANKATICTIFIMGFKAGPEVSLSGSPTVSPTTAAL